MSARILIVKNVQREGPGILRDVLSEHHVQADMVELGRGDALPSIDNYSAMVVLGGPASANDLTDVMNAEIIRVHEAINEGLPYLGICLGLQVLVKAAGGSVIRADESEIGFFDSAGTPFFNDLTPAGKRDPLFDGVPDRFRVFQLHGETVDITPEMELLATAPGCPNQVVRVGRRAYGLQSHIELVPEMLAVWAAQDSALSGLPRAQLQAELARISDQYRSVSHRIFSNFLAIAGLASAVDLQQSKAFAGHQS